MSITEKIADEYSTLTRQSASGKTYSKRLQLRDEAYQAFAKLGLPSTKHEEWRYTHIKNYLPDTLSLLKTPATPAAPVFHFFDSMPAHRLVFVNGCFQPELSSIQTQQGLTILNLKEAWNNYPEILEKYFGKTVQFSTEHFAALNTAFAEDGAFIHLSKNTLVELPIVVVYLSDNNGEYFTQSRNLIIAEEGAELTIIEDFQNIKTNEAFHNHVSELFLNDGAQIHLTQLQTETENTTAIYTTEAELRNNAQFNSVTVTLAGNLIRNNINTRLKGKNAAAHLNGLYYGTSESLIDNHLLVDHISPLCESNQLYKGILADEASGVFNGKVFVKQDAQKTNAFQSSKALLLSDEASINSKPQLEIYADDVKCSHGAAIGQLNKNELFYFLARGIEPEQAKSLLTYAFANDVLQKIQVDALRQFVEEKLKARLQITF